MDTINDERGRNIRPDDFEWRRVYVVVPNA
jgi:hypothetical protein